MYGHTKEVQVSAIGHLDAPDSVRRRRRRFLQQGSPTQRQRVPALRLPVRSYRPPAKLKPIRLQLDAPFALRENSCPYLEAADQDRRCLAGDTQPLDIETQVRACLRESHQNCSRFRFAESLPHTTAGRMAVYAVLIVVLTSLIVFAGVQSVRSADAAGSPSFVDGVQRLY